MSVGCVRGSSQYVRPRQLLPVVVPRFYCPRSVDRVTSVSRLALPSSFTRPKLFTVIIAPIEGMRKH